MLRYTENKQSFVRGTYDLLEERRINPESQYSVVRAVGTVSCLAMPAVIEGTRKGFLEVVTRARS